MLDGADRREPGRDEAAHETIDRPIGCRKQQDHIGIHHRLAPRPNDAGRVQHECGTDSDKDSCDADEPFRL
jgi:hypothetical protein